MRYIWHSLKLFCEPLKKESGTSLTWTTDHLYSEYGELLSTNAAHVIAQVGESEIVNLSLRGPSFHG